jgi:myo-inositol-1(or 4)-monophosphatase
MLAFAREVALRAGELLKEGLDRPHEVRYKGAIDLVTEMDVAAEKLILSAIASTYPDHAVLAEESGESQPASSGYKWVVDPLDGTTNYAHGLPIYCVSIGLEQDGEPLLGVIYAPSLGELFSAERGKGATFNDRPMRVSTTKEVSKGLLVTGFPYDVQVKSTNLAHFGSFIHEAQAVRRLGSAAIDMAWTAAGRFDGFWEPRLAAWDMCAGSVLVTEAGGRVTRYDGSPFSIYGREVLATNGHLHEPMMAVLARNGSAAPTQQVDR